MKVLIACEFSGIVSNEFRKLGHHVHSVDLLPCETGCPWHIQDDVLNHLDKGWDLMIAHPPCTYLAVSGIHWNYKIPDRSFKTEQALDFVKELMSADIPKICLENPVSIISTRIRKPDQIIQPWMFGHDASKKTCLWLNGLPLLTPTELIVKDRYSNQTKSGQNKLPPSPDRWKDRSRTYLGIAKAMANQWGKE